MDSSDAMQLLILVILLALSAFFSSAETALTCVNKIRIRGLAEEGDKRAILVKELTDNPSKMLSAILIGNNIVNLSASSLSTMLATKIAAQLGAGTNTATFVGLATGILTILILIFGEITPKSAATINAEKMSIGRCRNHLLADPYSDPCYLRNQPSFLWSYAPDGHQSQRQDEGYDGE